MTKQADWNRRDFLGAAVMTVAAAQPTFGSASVQGHVSFSPLKQIAAGVLNVGYAEAGPASGYLIGSREANKKPLRPDAELQWWYQFYFATERGRAGYEAYRRDFARLIWRIASPRWQFDDATFDRTAASFDNPDHVDIVIHNYRWRLGQAEGDPAHDTLENRLATGPIISVPAITLEGDANGAPHPAPTAYAAKFSGKYAHRNLTGGIGHNLPQEAPQAFATAVIDADRF